jgi:hypothetical protein
MASPGARRQPLAGAAPWLALALVIAASVAIRIRLADVPLERDEGGYAYFAQRWLRGEPPLASGYTMHLPGTAAVYAASLSAFGETARGVRLGLVVTNALTTLFLFLLARRMYGGLGAVAAAAAFAILSLSPAMLGPFAHATHFIDLFGVAGLWVLAGALASGSLPAFAAAGLLLGLASLAGVAVTLATLAASGVLPLAQRWYLEYPRSYAGMQSLEEGLRMLGIRLGAILPPAAGLLLLALAGLVLPGRGDATRPAPAGRAFLGTLLAFSLAGVSAGLYFRHHYFLLAVPAVALLAGRGVAAIGGVSPGRTAAAVGAAALACGLPLALDREVLLELPPLQVSRRIYGANPFPESVEVARYLRAHARPGDRVAVLGSEPQIYFHSGLRAATGYMYLYPLVEPNPLAPAMQEELIREVEEARPAWVVWVGSPTSWDSRVAAARPVVAWAASYLEPAYDLVGRAAILGPDRTEYAWGDDAARLGAGGASVLVLRRR